jgi:UDP-glucose 4-epimerase
VFPTPEHALPAPLSPYGVTKLAAEQLCMAYHANHGVAATALRYFTVFGPRQRPDMAFNIFCQAALCGDEIRVFGTGEQTRDFTFVSDVVAATRAAAETPVSAGRSYNVGGGLRASLADVVSLIEEFAGPLHVVHYGREYGDVQDTGADTTLARSDLAWQPKVSLRDGLHAEFSWLEAGLHSASMTVSALIHAA